MWSGDDDDDLVDEKFVYNCLMMMLGWHEHVM